MLSKHEKMVGGEGEKRKHLSRSAECCWQRARQRKWSKEQAEDQTWKAHCTMVWSRKGWRWYCVFWPMSITSAISKVWTVGRAWMGAVHRDLKKVLLRTAAGLAV